MQTRNVKLYRDINLQVLFGVTLVSIMGVTAIAPALPEIANRFEITSRSAALLITVFTLPGILLSPVIGILADRIGRKKVLVPSLIIFGMAGTACAITRDFTLLVVFRFIQGTGAAALGSLNLTVIGDLFTDRRRISAMGYNSTVLSIGAALYPALGGALVMLGWNFPFLLSLLAFPVAALVLFVLKSPEPRSSGNMGEYLTSAFSMIRNPQVLLLYFASLATFALLYGVLMTYFPFLMRSRLDSSPLCIGLIISSASIATSAGSWNLAPLTEFFSPVKLIISGFLLYAVSIFMIHSIESELLMVLPVMIYGFANGINIPSIQARIAESAPDQYRGAFMSFNSMVLRLGQTSGPLVAATAYGLGGTGWVFYTGIIFSMICAFILAVFLRDK